MKKHKFKDRYVLASGYVWYGHDQCQIQMFNKCVLGEPIAILHKVPSGLLNTEAPKYRLVLERVK